MIVEIYGLPASGKTALAEKLSNSAGFKIIKVRTRWELIFYNLKFFISHPIKFFILFSYIVKNAGSGKRFYHKLMNCFLHVNGRLLKAAKFEKAVVDQGYFLNILTVFENKLEVIEAKKYLNQVIKPDILIILDVSEAMQASRVGHRGYLAREEYGEEYKKRWLEIMRYNDAILKAVLSDLNISYCIINGDRDLEVVYHSVMAKINYEK